MSGAMRLSAMALSRIADDTRLAQKANHCAAPRSFQGTLSQCLQVVTNSDGNFEEHKGKMRQTIRWRPLNAKPARP
jgi:hypothetical protein